MLRRISWAVVPAALVTLPLAGCSQEVPLGTGAPAQVATDEPSPEPKVVPNDRNEGFQYCAGPGRYVAYDTFEVTGPVVVGQPEAEGSVRLRDLWYAPKPDSSAPTAGVLGVLPNGEVKATNWEQREPLEGARLEAGTYYLFAGFTAKDDDYLDAITLPFTTEHGAHTASYLQNATFDASCEQPAG